MGRLVPGVWIVMRNSAGCELDREFVPDPDAGALETPRMTLTDTVQQMVRKSILLPGDSITLEEGESEL